MGVRGQPALQFADRYFLARLKGRNVAAIGSVIDGPALSTVWTTYICLESANGTAAKVARAGGQVITPPFDVLHAGRMAVCADPAGATFGVWQPREHTGAQLVFTASRRHLSP